MKKSKLTAILVLTFSMLCIMSAAVSASDIFSEPLSGNQTVDTVLPENDELFNGYVESLFAEYIDPSLFSTGDCVARSELTAEEQGIYDAFAPIIRQIAAGERTSSVITIGSADVGGNNPTRDAVYYFSTRIEFSNANNVIHALLSDMPYDLYWFNKSIGWYTTIYDYANAETAYLSIKLWADKDYAGSEEYTLDTTKTGAAKIAVENAAVIVDTYKNVSDYEKLSGYKNEICSLVEYDHNALESGSNTVGINPWQIIHVFDNDPDTNVVCEGYSKAFQYLCDMTDFDNNIIQCYSVAGNLVTLSGAGRHMWNIVTMDDGLNYLTDITNSDSGMYGSDGRLFLTGAVRTNKTITVTNDDGTTETVRYYGYATDANTLFSYDSNILWNDSVTRLPAFAYVDVSGKTYTTVNFDANGGSVYPEKKNVLYGESYGTFPAYPILEGKFFSGWYTAPVGGDYVGEYTTVSKTYEHTLYAHWTDNVRYDAPLPGGRRLFGVDEIMYPGDEGTKFHNAFLHPDVPNPYNGQCENWTGAYYEETTLNGVDCVKVSIDPKGYTRTPIMDFNYYQWDASFYRPSLDTTKYGYLKITYAYNDAASSVNTMKFVASKDVTPLASDNLERTEITFSVVNEGNVWNEVIVYLGDLVYSDGTAWSENTVRQFRIKPLEGNTNKDAACYIAGIGFFETQEEAQAWNCSVEEITVNFDANGGEVTPKSQKVKYGYNYGEMPVPELDDRTFTGWYTAADGGILVSSSTIMQNTEEHTLYAHWKLKEYSAPIPGGNRLFGVDEIMYPGDEGTKYHNAFLHPDVWNPIDGQYEHWTGAYYEKAELDGIECVKVSVDPEGTTLAPMMDFNYYQWDSSYYRPSLDTTKYGYLKIKYAYNDAAGSVNTMKFVASKDVTPLGVSNLKNTEVTFNVENENGAWNEVIVYLGDLVYSDGTAWNENTVRQFRLQPLEGNTNEDAAVYIAYLGFFETEEEAHEWNGSSVKVTPGDINGDEAVTAQDSVLFSRKLAGWSGYEQTNVSADVADLNSDNSVNAVDSTILSRHLAGWTGYITIPLGK